MLIPGGKAALRKIDDDGTAAIRCCFSIFIYIRFLFFNLLLTRGLVSSRAREDVVLGFVKNKRIRQKKRP